MKRELTVDQMELVNGGKIMGKPKNISNDQRKASATDNDNDGNLLTKVFVKCMAWKEWLFG